MDERDFTNSDPELGRGPLLRRRGVSDTLYRKPQTKVCYFYKDADVNFGGVRIAINPKRYKVIETLKKELTSKVKGLPFGVRSIYTPGGHDQVDSVDSLQDNGRYVCSTHRSYAHGVDIGRVHTRRVWRNGRPPSGRKQHVAYLTEGDHQPVLSPPPLRPRKAWKPSNQASTLTRTPKKIQVIRNGDPTQKHMILLNRRTAQNFEQVLDDLGQMFHMAARRMFTLEGRPIKSLSSIFNGPDMYVLGGVERFRPLGALTDPGPLTITPSRSRRKPSNDVVAQRLRDKRDKLAHTRGKWKVWVSTNDLPAAGTNAQVSLTVYGHKGNSGPIPLGYGDGTTFQAGNIDEFEVAVGNIGEIFKIRISHDNSGGEFPGWLLDEVRMRDVHTDEQLAFKCARWLDRDQDDHEICRELPVTRNREASLPVVQYEVLVETGEVWNGGTDASVYVTLYGERGDTGVRQLLHSNRPDKFKKGNTDAFSLEAVSLGNLKRVIIGHDGTGHGAGWFLEKITIKEKPKGQEWSFPCSRWLDEGEDDGKIVRELKPQDEYRQDFIEKQMWEYEKWKFDSHNQVLLYSRLTQLPLRVKQDASLDANGEYSDPLAVFNVTGQRGMVRVFESAVNPKFHLAIDNGKVMGHGRGGAYCEFKVHVQVDRSVLLESNKYSLQHINVMQNGKTGDPRGALDDPAKQFFVFCKGVFRDQGVIMLCTSLRQTLNIDHDNSLYGTGKRNKLSHFRVHKAGEGNVRMFESLVFPKQYIQLKDSKFDVMGRGDSHCHFKVRKIRDKAYVSLESLHQKGICLGLVADGSVRPTVDTGEKNTRFYPEVIQWGIPKDKKTIFATEVVSSPPPPVDMKPKKVRKRGAQKAKSTPTPPPTQQTPRAGDWNVTVISDDDASNTEVILVVYGDRGNSGDILLGQAGTAGMFEAGNQDEFKVNLSKVGKIYKIRLELRAVKGTKMSAAKWKVREVKLKDLTTKEVLRFKFDRWLSQNHGDRDLMCELPAVRPAQDVLPVLDYEVETLTSSLPGADTDASVYITVFGERGDTGKRLLLESEHRVKFQEGQTDTFHLSAVSLGAIQRALLSHDGDGPGEGWRCERVVVREGKGSDKYYTFPCNRWMDTSIEDGKIERLLKVQAVDPTPIHRSPTPKPPTPKPRTPTPVARSPTPQPVAREATPRPPTPQAGEYTVSVTTGKQADMATTSRVVLVAYGNKGVSSETEVGEGLACFGAGRTHEVKVNFQCDLGELYKVRLGHLEEDRTEGQGWFLEKVKLKHERTEQLYVFKVNRWLSWLQEDLDVWRELPVVLPGKTALPVVIYTIEIQTGSRPGADTDADLYIKLIGRHGDSGKRLLFKSQNNEVKFQSGQLDVFKVEAVTLDELTQVWMGHAEKGKGAGWYCDHVTVREGPHPEAEVYHFPCYKWFDQGMEDKKTERLLERGEPPKDSKGQYNVYVTTASDSKPPGGATASITLYGSKSRSRDIHLSSGQPVFLPGNVDEFKIECGEVGELYKIRISREFGDDWDGWHLDQVRVVDQDTKKEFHFQCDRWLDLDGGDHHIVREMALVTDTDPLPVEMYEVSVVTGDHWAAQTDADVYITLFGSRGDTGRRYLTHSENSDTKFKRNQMDTFVVEAVNLDKLERLCVGHTGQGHGAGWFLERIVVRLRGSSETKEWLFVCQRWLDDHEDDRKTERELVLTAYQDTDHTPALPKEGARTQGEYEVRVTTSDLESSATHAQVSLTVYGEKGNSGILPLGSAGPNVQQWEQGQVYTQKISVGDIGDVTKIRIEHDNTHSFPSWHLDRVELEDLHTGEELHFPVHRWLADSEEDGALCRELPVHRAGRTASPVLRYYVATYTANVDNAATNANVFVTLYGERGDSGRRSLADSLIHQVKFLQDQIDVFVVECVCLGDLEKVCVSHDGTDKDSAWFLDKLIVKENLWSVTQWPFACSQWLEPGLGGEAAELELTTTGCELYSPLPSHELSLLRPEGDMESGGDWTVTTYTGHHDGPETNTTVSMVLCGTVATSEMSRLQGEEGDRHFLPGKQDQFEISVGQIGDLLKVRLYLDPLTSNPSWLLEKIKLKNHDSGQEFHLEHGKWVKKASGDTQVILELPAIRPDLAPLAEKTYTVSVTTGKEVKAETQATVYCDLIGPFGDAGKRQLVKAESPNKTIFQKGQTDVFTIQCLDVGPVSTVFIGHDRFGRGKGWFCEQVLLSDAASPSVQTVFPCHQWLDTGIGDRKIERILKPLAQIPVTGTDTGKLPPSKGMYKAFVSSAGTPNSNTGEDPSSGGNSNQNNNKNADVGGEETESAQCTQCGEDWLVCECDVLVADQSHTTQTHTESVTSRDRHVHAGDSHVTSRRSIDLNTNNNAGESNPELEAAGGVVSLMVYGDGGIAGPIELNNGEPDMFSPGKQDEFDLHIGDLGELYKIRVTHALARPWCLRNILLQDAHTKEKLTFDFSQFVGETGGDIRKELPVVKAHQVALPVLQYRVTVVTQSHEDQADSIPEVFVRLFGERGDSGSRHLNQIDAEGARGLVTSNFQHTFVLSAVDLSTVNKVVLTKGRGSPLYIQEVVVKKSEFAPVQWRFPYNEMISDNELVVKQEVELVTVETQNCPIAVALEECPHLPKSEGVWQVSTRTGSAENSGTDQRVQVVVCGDQAESPPINLIAFDTDRTPLQPGNTDVFMIQLREPVGEIQKVRLGFENVTESASWFCDTICFEDEATKDEFVIDINDWIKVDDESDGWREFAVDWPGVTPTPVIQYQVEVRTGDRLNAATDANVSLTIYGHLGNTGTRRLKKSLSGQSKFQQGGVDRFIVEAAHLGVLQMVIVGHDAKDSGKGWFLDAVEVRESEDGEPVLFDCDRWLDAGEEDGSTERTLLVSKGDREKGDPWSATIETGSDQSHPLTGAVVMVIVGDQGEAEVILSDDVTSQFTAGQEHTCPIRVTEDVGDVYKIRIGFQDNRDVAWQLMKVRLERLQTGETFDFVYGDFIVVDDEHNGLTEIPRFHADPTQMFPVHSYQVKIHTKDVHNAGTDANVYIQMFGTHGNTGRRPLRYSRLHGSNKFERDSVDVFTVPAVDLGQITSVTLGHDGEGFGAGWFLDDVSVRESEGGEETAYFKCDRWLDRGEEDGLTEKRLEVSQRSQSPGQTQENTGDTWSVLIRNGPDTSTDGQPETPTPPSGHALLVLYGESGRSEPQTLTSANPTRFLPNQTEQYEISVAEELGDVYKVRVGLTDDVKEERWPLDYLLLQKAGTDTQLRFQHAGLVTKDEDCDGWTEIPVQRDSDLEQERQKPVQHQLEVCTYHVEVYTSDLTSAGTDATVFLEVQGRHGDTGPRQLKKSQNPHKFEQNQMDEFALRAVDLGDLQQVRVWHDGKGLGAGWHLDKLVISGGVEPDVRRTFLCQRWLDEGEDDGKTELVLPLSGTEEKQATPQDDDGALWKVRVQSVVPSDDSASQYHMTSQLTVTLCGEDGVSDVYPLKSDVETPYQPGQTDQFEIRVSEKLGSLYKIRLQFAADTEVSAAPQAWLCESVHLEDTESGAEYLCECGGWVVLDEKQDGVVEIACVRESKKTLPVVTYSLQVYTADCVGAGTNALVTVVIDGEHGSSGERQLKYSSNNDNKFEQNQMDEFELQSVDLGSLSSLRVKHDGRSAGAGWFLDQIVVKSSQPEIEYVFPCHRWLDEGEDDGLIERTLSVLPQPGEPWTVTMVTSTEAGAGTAGPAELVLYTEKGRSKAVRIGEGADFIDGETQSFPVQLEFEEAGIKSADIQEVYKVRVMLDPAGERDKELYWFLDKVALRDITNERDFVFDYNERVSANEKKDGQVEIALNKSEEKLAVYDYQVEIYTKDVSNAGTDANVYLQICGRRGDTGVRKMLYSETAGNKFESGMRDLFTVPAVDLGDLIKVVVGHDGKGLGSGWFLDKVVIREGVNGKQEFHFPCDKWLDKEAEDHLTERELELSQPAGEAWCVTLVTSEGGGTEGPVQLEVFGETGPICEPLIIGQDREMEGTLISPVWVQRAEDQTTADMYKIRLTLDPQQEKGSRELYWDLEKVYLEDLEKKQSFEFLSPSRLSKTDSVDGVMELAVVREEDSPQVLNYYVEVYTKDESGAGTDAKVHLVLYGSRGDTGKRLLLKSHVEGDKFESGKMDAFVVPAVDLGTLTKLCIGHDGAGFGSGWYLDRVVVKQNVASATNFVFDCNKLLEDETKEVELPLSMTLDDPDSSASDGDWQIQVTTSSQPEAATTGQVTLTVLGSQGETEALPLGEPGKGLFEAGQTDEFDVYVEPEEVGELQRFKLTVEEGQNWKPEKVVFVNAVTETMFEVPIEKTITRSEEFTLPAAKETTDPRGDAGDA